MRMQRHLAVATAAAVACLFVSLPTTTLAEGALLTILVGVVLNSLARALDARIGYLWGWVYPEPAQSAWFDRLADRAINRPVAPQVVDESPVRVLPLDPPAP